MEENRRKLFLKFTWISKKSFSNAKKNLHLCIR